MTSVAWTLESSMLPPKHEGEVVVTAQRGPFNATPVAAGSEEEVVSALSAPSLTNVIMTGFIRDNTLVSPLNRGRFYSCRSDEDKFEGVALIGHTVLFEAFTERAIEAFAT